LIHAGGIKYREIERQGLAYPKSLGRVVCQIIVGESMDERPQAIGLNALNNGRQRLAVEVNLVLRYWMWSDCTICHVPYEDDVSQVTRAFLGLQVAVQLSGS
jgi:hypothetical protein